MTFKNKQWKLMFGLMLFVVVSATILNNVAEGSLMIEPTPITLLIIDPVHIDPGTVLPQNNPPGASDDSAETAMNMDVTIDVLSNDVDPDGDSLFVESIAIWPENGDVEINVDDTITYTPFDGFVGTDSFDYMVSDGNGGTDTALVTVDVFGVPTVPQNNPPGASDDSAETAMNMDVTIDVLSNDVDPDGDSLFVESIAIWPENGDVEINVDDTITYTPFDGFVGTDSFDYMVSDGNGGTDTALVTVDVFETNPELTITQSKSGLVAFDVLNNDTRTMEQIKTSENYWRFGGSAAEYFEPDAPFDYFQNSTGMFIGTQAPSSGVYAGYYAVTPSTDAALFHAVITTPYASVPSDFFQNGLYVQTDNGLINYVTCVSVTSTAGTTWHLIQTYGDGVQTNETKVLWSDGSTEQPLTRDCTIITNGDNYLKLYMDGTNVYESEALDLQMPGPFLYFLEPQNSYAGEMLYGIYEDYYATTDEKISIINAPLTSERVDLVDMSGNVLESSPVVDGTSVMAIGQYTFPLDAEIKVINSDGMEIASKSASIYGGDEYSVYPNTP